MIFREDEIAKIVELYQQDRMSLAQIGDLFGVHQNTICRCLERQGIPRRPGGKGLCPPKLNPEQERKAIEMYQSRMTLKEVADTFGVYDSTIRKLLIRQGVPRRRSGESRRKLSPEQEREVVEMYQQAGLLTREIGDILGVDDNTIRLSLIRQGIPRRPRGGRPNPRKLTLEQELKAVEMRQSGLTLQEIANTLGIKSKGTIGNYLDRQGVPRAGPNKKHLKNYRGYYINGAGYKEVIPSDEDLHLVKPGKDGYILEHRLVIARMLGRPLKATETVHHINGIRDDNRPENLQLRQGQHGAGVAVRCLDCGSGNVEAIPLADGD